MTGDQRAIDSILALDCGSTFTRVDLFDRVEGVYRFVGQGADLGPVETPGTDLANSVRRALGQLSEAVRRRFLGPQGDIICPEHQGDGVDTVVATVSAAEPLRVVLAGFTHDESLATAQCALSTTYSLVEGVISRDGRGGGSILVDGRQAPSGVGVEDQIRLIQTIKPDAVVIVGGVDGGAGKSVLQVVKAITLACFSLPAGLRPAIVYAGNGVLRAQVSEIVGEHAELRIAENVSPSADMAQLGPLQQETDTLYRLRKVGRLPGAGRLTAWSSGQVLPAARAYAHAVEQIARVDGINVLGVDLGGASTTVASVLDEQLSLIVRSDLGMSRNIAHLLDLVSPEWVQRWLPFEVELAEVRNALHYKASRPRTLPKTSWDFLLEQAVAREILRIGMDPREAVLGPERHRSIRDSCRPADRLLDYDLIVGSGGVLAHAPSPAQAALVMLDALQPVGITGLALDQAGLLAPLGAVAMAHPLAAAQALERDGLLSLGTVVAPLGAGRDGETALVCRVDHESGQTQEVEVLCGSLRVIPLGAGQVANLEVRPTRHFDVGLGVRGQAGVTRVRGGTVGIILDARGRPLPLDEEAAKQRKNVKRWLQAAAC